MTFDSFESFDLMAHEEGADDWLVQNIGAPETLYGDQMAVPEPSAFAHFDVAALGLTALVYRRRRRGGRL